MKVLIKKTGAVLDVEASYGARLIEQGRATFAPEVPEEKPVKEEAPQKTTKKKG